MGKRGRRVSIRMILTDDERSGHFENFAALLPQSGEISFTIEKGEPGTLPAIVIEKNWRYHLVPEGAEAAPFFNLISQIAGARPEVDETLRKRLKDVGVPTRIDIFASPHCPHCAAVVSRISPFPLVNSFIEITLIDPLLFPESAPGIHSVPVVACKDCRWTGRVPLNEVVEVLTQPDPTQWSSAIFRHFVEAGDAGRLARMMLDQDRVFPAFSDLLIHPEFSIRLGAMVVVEEIGAANAQMGWRMIRPLEGRLASLDESVRGDIVYLIGEFGGRESIPILDDLLGQNPSHDLREALEEALEKVKNKP